MDGKKPKKKELDGTPGRIRRVAGTLYIVGGRVREGKPPKLWSNFGHGPKTPAAGAVDLIATRIPLSQARLTGWLGDCRILEGWK